MKNMSTFQILLTVFFGLIALAGFVAFILYRGFTKQELPEVTMWGSMSEETFGKLLLNEAITSQKLKIKYVEKTDAAIDSDLPEAIASGNSPDLVLISQESILKQQNKLLTVPFTSYAEQTFKDTFIAEGDLFLNTGGVTGIPFLIDPMVMYFNRTLFDNAGIASAPVLWDDFFTLAPKFNTRDAAGNLTRTIGAFGLSNNIEHFKDTLTMLLLQQGNPIVSKGDTGYMSTFASGAGGKKSSPAEGTVRFLTEFSNPIKPVYAWNRSFSSDKEAFLAGQLGTYFGYASELQDLRRKNPNLNFEVRALPAVNGASFQVTYGKLYALVIPKASQNPNAAFQVALGLTNPSVQKALQTLTLLPPVRRDLLSAGTGGTALNEVLYKSALSSRGWLDPDASASRKIFGDMLDDVTSGRSLINEAVLQADTRLTSLLGSIK